MRRHDIDGGIMLWIEIFMLGFLTLASIFVLVSIVYTARDLWRDAVAKRKASGHAAHSGVHGREAASVPHCAPGVRY